MMFLLLWPCSIVINNQNLQGAQKPHPAKNEYSIEKIGKLTK
jgi:hypothetical protein